MEGRVQKNEADVAELEYALASGVSGRSPLWVRVPPSAHERTK